MRNVLTFLRNNIVIAAIAILLIMMLIISPNYFAYSTFTTLLTQIAVYGIVACAMTISLIGGEFDLSVGSIVPFATLLFAQLLPSLGIIPSVMIVLIFGLACGCVNGLFVGYLKINAFIVTLATQIMLQGAMLMFCNGKPIAAVNDITNMFGVSGIAGISWIAIIYFVCVAVTYFVLRKTNFGRNVFATGGNYDVAQYAGIPVKRIKCILFIILGGASALAGTLLAFRLQAGSPLYGADVCMYSVSAAVLGGTSLSGGKGSAIGTLLGMIFMGILTQIFLYVNVYTYLQQMIQGLIVVFVVLIDALPKSHVRKIKPETAA